INSLGLDEKETLYNFDLTKSGRYQPLAESKDEKEEIPDVKEEIPEEEKIEIKSESNNKDGIETVETLFEEKIPAIPPKPLKQKEKKKPIQGSRVKKIDVEKTVSFVEQPEIKKPPQKKSINISPSIFKSLGITAVILLMAYGIYLLVTTVFITGTSKSKF
ncbi:MAG: hypothetical protein NTU73_00005, partial [Ignavibacteriae bacterium]|nr:hypothetical protein [Ignavibacteriota bacterium]